VLDHRHVYRRSGGQDLAHDFVVQNGLAVICERHGSSTLERSKICELLATTADRCCSHRKDICVSATGRIDHPARDLSGIVHRAGIGHGADRGKTSCRSSHGPVGDCFLV
jgi:hypothetical protein